MSAPAAGGPFDGKTHDQLVDDARRAMFDAAAETPWSIERAMAWTRYDAIVAELQRRLALRLNEGLGLPPIDL